MWMHLFIWRLLLRPRQLLASDLTLLTWNVRGAAKRHFVRSILDVKRLNTVRILVVLEPRISGDHALQVISKLGFTNYFVVDAVGFSGGPSLLWKHNEVHV